MNQGMLSGSSGRAVASSSGIIIGRVQKLLYGRQPIPEEQISASETESEVARLRSAIAEARSEIEAERDHLQHSGTGDMVMMLDVHRMLIVDPELFNRTCRRIESSLINAEWALRQEMDAIETMFDRVDDEYLRNRKNDVEHAGCRILQHLQGSQPQRNKKLTAARKVDYPLVYLCDDLSVSDMVAMWRHGVAGVVIEQGGSDAHNIIVARGIGLPALVGAVDILNAAEDGDTIILDAEQGEWILRPSPQQEAEYAQAIEAYLHSQVELHAYAGLPSRSHDGRELKLMANIEFPEELDAAEAIGIDGVGLYRSEFLFMNGSMPDEEAQFAQYMAMVERLDGKPLTMRLLDLGGDKPWRYHELTSNIDGGANPALGLRGIRLLLRWPDVMRSQIRAMLRAGEYGPVELLVPMVTTVDEMVEVRRVADACAQELRLSNTPVIGAMIEVPASALIADALAEVSDFFSIGTNDLMQYTLAADRTDEEVADLYRTGDQAITQLINMAAAAAKRAGIPISVCGELSASPAWTEHFLNLEMHALSMSMNRLLQIRRHLSQLTFQSAL